MRRIVVFLVVICCGILFYGCELDTGENFFFVNMEITEVDVPEFLVLNESHNLDVTFSRADSCTFFQGFDVFTEENGRTTVIAIGSVLTEEECNAGQESLNSIVTLLVEYQVPFYQLRFYSGEDEAGNPTYLEYNVPVVDGINQ